MTKPETKPRRRVDHEGPSAESLREMPEIDYSQARKFKGRGPEAMANAQAFFAAIRGRPRKGTTATGTRVRSLRLPEAAWTELERAAAEREMTLHKFLRKLVAEFLYTDPPKATPATGRRTAVKRRPRRAAARRVKR